MATKDYVAIRIKEKLRGHCQRYSQHCIFKVPNQLRTVNEKAYEPQIIAIGPYHHGKVHLEAMEEHKVRYLQMFLKRSTYDSVSGLVQTMRDLQIKACNCYSEPVSLKEDEFVEMMVFDACFIVEFLSKINEGDLKDPIFQKDQINSRLKLDLLLVENQLPFFVLMKLFETIPSAPDIIDLILKVYKEFLPGAGYSDYSPNRKYSLEEMNKIISQKKKKMNEIKHILALVHDNWQPLPERMKKYLNSKSEPEISFPRCVMELQEAGIELKKIEKVDDEGHNIFDISFENGVMKIPKLEIDDDTERIMRNLIAYEQLNSNDCKKYVTEYMIFMDSLINSEKDVEKLCRKGIIENWLGDDKTVAALFNRIGDEVFMDRALYADIQEKVHQHCSKQRNVWMANLKHNYFNSPWSGISVAAAFILLVLTCIQTVFAVISFVKQF